VLPGARTTTPRRFAPKRGTGSTTTLHAWLRPRRTVIPRARRSRMISGY